MNIDAPHPLRRRIRPFACTALAGLVVAATVWQPAAAAAQALDTDKDPAGLDCLAEVTGTFGALPERIVPGQGVTLSWSVQAPASCGALRVTMDGLTVPRSGSMAVDGISRTSAEYAYDPIASDPEAGTPGYPAHLRTRYVLRAAFGSASRLITTTNVEVRLPIDPSGRP